MSLPVVTILHLEDSDLDAELVRDRIEKSGLLVHVERACERRDFIEKLKTGDYDIVLSDYQVPSFNGLDALRLAQEFQPDTPFIFVSGAMGEELAVESLKRGATDYVLKDRLAKLGQTISRALAEARERINRRIADHRAATILESMADGFCTFNKDWAIGFVNSEAERLLGRSRDTLLGSNFWVEFPEAVDSEIERYFCDAVVLQESIEFETHRIRRNHWILVRACPYTDGLSIYFRDITDRKQTAAALEQSEERLQFALKAGRMGTWNLVLDDCKLTASDICKANYGRLPDEPFSYSDLLAAVLDEDRERWQREVEEAIRRATDFTLEYRTRWRDNSIHWIQVRGSCTIDSQGKAVSLSGVSTDITDRKMAEERARGAAAANAKFRTMFEQGTQFAGILSLEGIVIEANRLCLESCGFARDEVIGKYFWECGWWNPSRQLMDSIRQATLGAVEGRHFRDECSYFIADGRERTVDLAISPVTDDSGKTIFVAATGTDITERVRVEKRQRFLTELALATQPMTDPEEVICVTAQMLGDHLGADRCAYAEIENGDVFVITGNYTRDIPSIVGRWSVKSFGSEVMRLMQADLPYVVRDIENDPRLDEDLSAYRVTKIRAAICIPLHKAGQWVAAMAVHQKDVRNWTDDEVTLVQLVVGRCWESLERIRVVRALRESEAQFRQLAETIPNLAWMAHPDGHIFWFNRRWYEFTGTNLESMEGWGWQDVHDPDVLPEVVSRWKESIETGTPFNMVFPLRRFDGEFRPFLTLVHPLRGPDDQIVSWFGTNTEITEQKRAQEELARAAEAEKKRSLLLNRVAQASKSINSVLSVDSIVRILAEESRAIVGSHISVVCHSAGGELTPPLQALSLSEKYASFRRREAPMHFLCRHVCRSNSTLRLTQAEVESQAEWEQFSGQNAELFPLRGWMGVPLIGHGGDNLGLIHLSDKEAGDFTAEDEAILIQLAAIAAVGVENARLYERLREQDRRKDEFLATLAHELRNPLAPIRNGIKVLNLTNSPETSAAARKMMERQVGHMVRLIDDLLDISRITRGKVELRIEQVEISKILDAAIEVSRPLIEAGRHEFLVHVPRQPIVLNADVTRIAQVVSNLLNNAAKYTPQGGRIELIAAREGSDAIIKVKDNGVGISREMLPKIFEMFTQVGRSLDRAQGGLGIGLALVTRLVEMHGGSITGSSPGLGKGSTFIVRLPITSSIELANIEDENHSEISVKSSPQHRVLIVDDNVDSADSLAMLLKFEGHTTATAYNGHAALRTANEFRPNIVFLDIGLPGLSGYEVARRLRQNPLLESMTLIALTGWGTEDDRRQARSAGFDYHLTKPIDPMSVMTLLNQLD